MYISEGATYVIRHPDLVLVSPSSAFIGVPEGDRPGPAVETFQIVDLAHIIRLEEVEPAAKTKSNGEK
jgi:hypothetical protein